MTYLVSRPHKVNFISQFVLDMRINGEMITKKSQSGTGSFITRKKEHKSLGLDIFIIKFFASSFIFCIKHQL